MTPRFEHSRFEHSVALTGIGRSVTGRRRPPGPSARALEATQTAIIDAGLEPADIDGVCGVPGATGLPGISTGGFRELEQSLGLRPPGTARGGRAPDRPARWSTRCLRWPPGSAGTCCASR